MSCDRNTADRNWTKTKYDYQIYYNIYTQGKNTPKPERRERWKWAPVLASVLVWESYNLKERPLGNPTNPLKTAVRRHRSHACLYSVQVSVLGYFGCAGAVWCIPRVRLLQAVTVRNLFTSATTTGRSTRPTVASYCSKLFKMLSSDSPCCCVRSSK